MRIPNFSVGVLVGTMLLCTSPALADAIVRTQAMFADTIAEYYIEDDHVGVELEIGSNDVGAFYEDTEFQIKRPPFDSGGDSYSPPE